MRPIDADAVEAACKSLADKLRNEGQKTDAELFEALASIVKYCPTLDVEPIRHGHWVRHVDELLGDSEECSACHAGLLGKFPRCPICGAIMDEPAVVVVEPFDEAPAVDSPAVGCPADDCPAVDNPAVGKEGVVDGT